ncbi:hypothetical protein AMTRI_Chr02g214450 [Amborella trichopoda]
MHLLLSLLRCHRIGSLTTKMPFLSLHPSTISKVNPFFSFFLSSLSYLSRFLSAIISLSLFKFCGRCACKSDGTARRNAFLHDPPARTKGPYKEPERTECPHAQSPHECQHAGRAACTHRQPAQMTVRRESPQECQHAARARTKSPHAGRARTTSPHQIPARTESQHEQPHALRARTPHAGSARAHEKPARTRSPHAGRARTTDRTHGEPARVTAHREPARM